MSKTQSNPISLEEAQMALFKMRTRDWQRFYIWTQGWNNWQPLELFLKSDQNYFVPEFKASAPDDTVKYRLIRDVLEMNQVDENTHKEITASFSGVAIKEEMIQNPEPQFGKSAFDGDDLNWDLAKKPEINFKKLKEKMSYGNRSDRHNLKIEILLISNKDKTFRSISKNISLTGSLLEDNIPFDYYGVVFDIVIVNRVASDNKNARLKLKATTVGDGLTQRLHFYEVTDQQKMALQNLLQDYLKQQSRLTQKTS